MIKKKIKSTSIWIVLTICAYFLWGILDTLKMKKRIVDTLLFELPKKILLLAMPDFVFLLTIIIILMILWNQKKKFKGLTPERFKELLADNQRMQKHNQQLIETYNSAITRNEEIFKELRVAKDSYPHIFEIAPSVPLVFEDNVYWRYVETGDPEGPFCTNCYDENRKEVHLLKVLDSTYYKCPACDLRVARPSGRTGAPIIMKPK